MGKYEALAKEIIVLVGGKNNVRGLTHCITRLRFQLKDESKADVEGLKQTEGVVTVMKSGGQFQVVIGNHVADVYADVCETSGIGGDMPTQNEKGPKKNVFDAFIDTISNIFQPILAVLTAAGMIKGLNALFAVLGWYSDSSGTYIIINTIGDAMFMYLPIMLSYTASKKFGLKPFVGLVIGAALCYPAIQSSTLSAAGEPLYTLFKGTMFASPVYLEFLGIPVIALDYTSTVIPVILIVYFASKCEKLWNKIIPDVMKFFFVPMFTLFMALTIGFIVIGPIATFGSNLVANGIMAVRDFSPLLAGGLIGFFWQILVIFGLHWGIIPIYINNIMTTGFDSFMMPFFAGTFAQTAVVIAILIKTRNKKLKEMCVPAAISGVFGISEPAIYGITLPYKKPFIISCIAAGVAGAYYGYANLKEFIIGGMGIFEFPAMIDPATKNMDNVIVAIIGVVIAMVIGFVLTLLTFKDKEEKQVVKTKQEDSLVNKLVVSSPLQGKTIPLSALADDAFAKGIIGKGIAILPMVGEIYAPVDGVITTLFPTLHAIGITGDQGEEVLIHVGLNTVQLNGEGFHAHVKQGDRITRGDHILSFDKEAIEGKGYSLETPVIITNSNSFLDIIETDKEEIVKGDELITIIR